MGHVEDHVQLISDDPLPISLYRMMQSNNNRTRRIRYIGGREMEPITELATAISSMRTLAEANHVLRQVLVIENEQQPADWGNIEITDLDHVTEQQCVRLVKRGLARITAAREQPRPAEIVDIEMV